MHNLYFDSEAVNTIVNRLSFEMQGHHRVLKKVSFILKTNQAKNIQGILY